MLPYSPKLKRNARRLRSNLTDAERMLWSRLRAKQILGVPFYRQKPIGTFIVDFYCPVAKLAVEIDGGQHFESDGRDADRKRDAALAKLGLEVLRFDNLQVLGETEAVLERIYELVRRGLARE